MAKYRKKPVVIEAVQYEPYGAAASRYFHQMPEWLEAAYDNDLVSNVSSTGETKVRLKIKTLEGDMYANEGDWIIQGIQGELYSCKPDIFAATYEPAE